MKNRLGLIAAAVTVGLLVTGISWAALDEESNVNVGLAAGQEIEIPVEDAGTVRLANSGTSLTILAAQASAGFVVEVEVPEGREVEADFRGEGRRLQFNAELEDGTVRVRIRSEANIATTGPTSTTATTTNGTSTTATTTNGTSTTSTTVDDNGGDDDDGDDGDDKTGSVPSGPVTYQVAGAGSVTVLFVNGQVESGLVVPAPGWSIDETRQRPDEIEVRFTNGDQEARLKVRIDDGQVRVEIEDND